MVLLYASLYRPTKQMSFVIAKHTRESSDTPTGQLRCRRGTHLQLDVRRAGLDDGSCSVPPVSVPSAFKRASCVGDAARAAAARVLGPPRRSTGSRLCALWRRARPRARAAFACCSCVATRDDAWVDTALVKTLVRCVLRGSGCCACDTRPPCPPQHHQSIRAVSAVRSAWAARRALARVVLTHHPSKQAFGIAPTGPFRWLSYAAELVEAAVATEPAAMTAIWRHDGQ